MFYRGLCFFFFSSRRRHTRCSRDWSSDVCSSDLRGVEEIIEDKEPVETGRIRQPGGGRKSKRSEDSTLLPDLERLVEPATRGDPMRVLRWTSKSLRHLSEALHGQGHSVCPHVIADCLRELGYSLQANRKTREGSSHMDRDAQFHYINDQAKAFLAANEPVISVDTKKKKELVGNFKNNGREWHPKAAPEAVNVRSEEHTSELQSRLHLVCR